MIPGAANPLLLASAQAGAAYNIERSVRFNAPDSAYLSRTPSVAGNRKTWTWAGWVKRSGFGDHRLFSNGNALSNNIEEAFGFRANGTLEIWNVLQNVSFNWRVATAAVFRDTSAWYHIVVKVDTTQATLSDRIVIYINGAAVTSYSLANYPTQNSDLTTNSTVVHNIGASAVDIQSPFDGYLADIHFIDGQALDPSSFGEFDANGVWRPKAYTGSYGTNGFHLPFSDNSTTAALGTDTSGAGNNWTVNNISVAAGSDNDSLVDTPTSYGTDTGTGGEVRGNYAVMNAIQLYNSVGVDSATLSEGNLKLTTANYTGSGAAATIAVNRPGGNFYWEVQLVSGVTTATNACQIGLSEKGGNDGEQGLDFRYNSSDSPTYTNGDIIGCAYNSDASTLTFYKNNVLAKTITSVTSTFPLFPYLRDNIGPGSIVAVFNFGQRPFAYTAPSGFKALCTTNLPEPQTVTTSGSYTGNGVADGPFVYLNGVPTAMTVNGNAVTFGTHADKLSNGFKLRTTSTTYNQNAATYNYSVTSTGPTFKTARAQSN